MRWSLILSAFIAVQSALSFVCVALAIPPQLGELERRALRPRRSKPGDEWKLSSKDYRKNAEAHPYGYLVNDIGPRGKLTTATSVRKVALKSEEAKAAHVKNLFEQNHPIHAGMLLRAVWLPVQYLFLVSRALIVDHIFEVQMLVAHLKEHNIDSKFRIQVHAHPAANTS